MTRFTRLTTGIASLVLLTATLALHTTPMHGAQERAATSAGAAKQVERIRNAREEVARTGVAGPAVKALLNAVPKVNGLYIIEGDILLSESEVVQEYLPPPARPQQPGVELKLNKLPNGSDDVYPRNGRRLTYAVDRSSFQTPDSFQTVVANMDAATKAWQDSCPACGITFVHEAAQDNAPTPGTVNFVVRRVDAQGQYIAAAFFPHDPPLRRFLNVDQSYYSTRFDKVGVLRHELGHVLGYRHEHISNVPGCYSEDNSWRPLSPYDPHSVMHYFCGGAGSLELKLSSTDISSHRALYQ